MQSMRIEMVGLSLLISKAIKLTNRIIIFRTIGAWVRAASYVAVDSETSEPLKTSRRLARLFGFVKCAHWCPKGTIMNTRERYPTFCDVVLTKSYRFVFRKCYASQQLKPFEDCQIEAGNFLDTLKLNKKEFWEGCRRG